MGDDGRQTTMGAESSLSRSSDGIKPPENVNLMPGGTQNTAGGKIEDFTIIDGVKSIRWASFKEFHKKPCVRDALLTGIAGGVAVGGLTAIWWSRFSASFVSKYEAFMR
jgi:cytochrome c oxidase assembly protein subunit 20